MTDRNGTTHTYAYDALGRMTSDTITTLGSGVDGSIMRLGYTYNSQGLPYQQTSYSDTSGTNVVNQVEDVYNGLGQLTGEYQEHSGPVVATSSAEVTYVYTEMASGVNNSRMTSMTYPDGRIVHYGYNTGIDDAISRLSYTADDNGSGSAGVHLEDDQYLGLDTVVVRAHPQDGVDMSLIKQPSDTVASSDGGDQYTGLDRFGRVIDQNWNTNDGSTNAASVDRYQYGYDADGNVTSKANDVKSIFSETYTYDTLNQLTGFNRSGAASQTYNLDPLGNRTSVSTTDADTVGGSVTNDYTTNAQNQIESMTDASGTNTASLGYDNDGNTLADDAGNTYTYDAWNRQATVSTSIQSGSNTVTVGETYGYDANGKRITSYVTGSAASGNTADNLYFSDQWQIVQETLVNTVGSGTSAVTTTTRNEYTWASGVYVNALIERDQTQTISPMGATNGLYASYFGAGSPDSLPIHDTDSNINFDWSSTGPAALPSQGINVFYVRWTGQVDAASTGTYTLNLSTGGVAEVKIDGKVVIFALSNFAGDIDGDGAVTLDDINIIAANNGTSVPPGTGGDYNDNGMVDAGDMAVIDANFGMDGPVTQTATASFTQSAGEHNIEVDYFQLHGLGAGEAGISLSWVTPSNTNSVTIPTASFTPQQSSTRVYAMQDANFNVTGLIDVNGNVVQRAVFTPYGQATVLNADWSPSTATFGSDAIGWTIGFQGGYTDPLSGKVIFQHRDYDAVTGTWMEVYPAGYADTTNLYQYERGRPLQFTDAAGLAAHLVGMSILYRVPLAALDATVQGNAYSAAANAYMSNVVVPNNNVLFNLLGAVVPKLSTPGPFDVTNGARTVDGTAIPAGAFGVSFYLFFVSAHVCEDNKGDAVLDVQERDKTVQYDPANKSWTDVTKLGMGAWHSAFPAVVRPALGHINGVAFAQTKGVAGCETIIFADIPFTYSDLKTVPGTWGDQKLRNNTVEQKVTIKDFGTGEVLGTVDHTFRTGYDQSGRPVPEP